MGIDVEQWRAKIGLWHAFTTGRPLLRRRRCKPLRAISVRRHECKRAFKARQKRRQKTSVRCQFLPFVVVLTLFVVVDSRINTLNNLSCRLASTRFYPAIRLAATLFLAGTNRYRSMDKRRNTGMEPPSLISQYSVVPILAMLLILAGDVEQNPGPFKLVLSSKLGFLCSVPLVIAVAVMCSSVMKSKLIEGDRPSLHVLRQFPVKNGFKDIVSEIQNDYQHFGTLLLEDENGNVVKAIEKDRLPVDITVEILRQWLQGKGRLPVTWQTLVNCLRNAKLNVAADYIDGALIQEHGSTDSDSTGSLMGQQLTASIAGIVPTMREVVLVGILGIVIIVVVMKMWRNSSDALHTQKDGEEVQRTQLKGYSSSVCPRVSEKPPFGCGCGKCTFFSFLERGCPKPIPSASSFPYLDLSGLTHEQQQELRGRLCFESQEIMMQFQKLVSATIVSIEKQQIPLTTIRSHIMTLGAFAPMHEGSQMPALNNHSKHLHAEETVPGIFLILKDNLSFFNYHILEHIITVLGTEEDKENLQRYKKEFDQYAKRRIYECLPQFGPVSENGYVDVFVKVDSQYERYTVAEVEIFRCQLSKILNISYQGVLRLCRVEKGCFQLTFQVPTFVQQGIFPLSSQQERALEEKGVIRLMCGEYQFIRKEHQLLHHRSSKEEISHAASIYQELSKAADCVYEQVTEESTLELELVRQKDISPFKADIEPEGGTKPTDSPDKGDWNEIPGGYDCKFVEVPPNAFQTDCPVCRLLLRDPYQATCCGTSFCYTCSQRIKAGSNHCPTCRKDNFEVFPNKGLKRSIYQLCVFCTHRKDGCTWVGELGELEHHLNKVIHPAARSSADVPHDLEVDSTPLDVYAEKLKARYRCKPKRKNIWPPQITKKYFNLALIKEETVRKGELSDEFTRLTITGKIEDILKHKEPIELPEVFKKTADNKKMTILMEGCPGSGKTVLTQHLCLQWVDRKLFQAYKLVILVRLREPAIHNAKEVKEVIPRVGMEEEAMKEIESSHGKGILFILDGWDELPEDVPGHDTIYNIINRETLPDCDVVITSRPTTSASLHDTDLISSRIEILGFTPGELEEFFTEHLDGDASKAKILLQLIKANPIVAGTCALPLNAAILVFIFKQHGVLPSTEHGIFEALIISCILRHLKERTQLKIKDIESLTDLPHEVQDAHSDLCKTAYEGVMKDQVIFKRSGDFNTLGLLQAVECFTYKGTKYFYNFLHLSIQEFLAAQHIATFEPTKQVEEFNKLFGQARFSSTFRHYSAITKLATPGIKEIVLRILKRCAAGHPRREDKTHLLSLLNCLHEAQEPALYAFVADNLGPKLDLGGITLNPADCLSINFFLRNATDIELNLQICSIGEEGVKMLFSQDQVYQLQVLNLWDNQIGTAGAEYLGTALKECTKLESLNLQVNNIGNAGAESLGTALKECTKLEYLNLGINELSDGGVDAISTSLTKLVHLRVLYLHGNQFADVGCTALGAALKDCRKLQVLDLGDNQISDSGCIKLCNVLQECRELQLLYLELNRISDGSIHKLRELIKRGKFLKELYVWGNQFTEKGKTQLREAAAERNCYPDFVKLNLHV